MSLWSTSARGAARRPEAPRPRPSCLLLVVGVLLALPSLAAAQYKTERAPFNEFLNYGKKILKPGDEIGNEIIKSKVDVLGEIFKQHVHRLRQVPNQRIELVFLVDASASVGAENFFNEIKFVKKLLADFAVSYNQTRVAVITFSSRHKVIRHIDHVTQASEDNHKCSLLERELPRIRYSGGGTYTLGALLEAQSIIALARPDAVKAVFLVTDGYSNGGDPRPAAEFLQARGVRIFTFGIRNGNVKELYDMASVPKEEHSYILDSFEEFEALARRALHEDLHSGVYMSQDRRACFKLCKGGEAGGCCDTYAACTCGTHTGQFACTCQEGYYGNGLRGNCRPCPAGTYKDVQGPGDVSSCIPCPDTHMLSAMGSTSLHQCYCKRGYTQIGMKCTRMQCPHLTPPENGYFVRNTCSNVVNAACGIRCNPGYTLQGSSIRLCGEDGTWSGGDAQCVMKSCQELHAPANGILKCSQERTTIDTECTFTCDPGFQLVGSRVRTCLPVAMWDGIPAYCKPIFCPSLPPIHHGRVSPATCASSKPKYGLNCEFLCDSGYQLKGPKKTSCVSLGIWSAGLKASRCIDVTPPVIQCPANQTVATEPHESYALVNWDGPSVTDNSGGHIGLASIPVTTQPMKLGIGRHTIKYLAKDKMGNRASCQFSITVLDEEPPRVDECESPPIFLSHEDDVDVYWEEPIFSDNSGKRVQVSKSLEPGQFPQGDTLVEYWAVDEAGNSATCNITITVQRHACQLPVDPINGAANCTENPDAIFCTLTCYDGYAFAMRPQQDYFCAYDGVWLPDDNPVPFPDCSVTSISNSIAQEGELALEDDGSVCDDIFLMGQVENQLEKKLEEALNTKCNEDVVCEVAAVEAVCEEILAEAEEEFNTIGFYRRKRSIAGASLIPSWPGGSQDPLEAGWRYWFRGSDTHLKRIRRETLDLSSLGDMDDLTRHKRQFGFSLDHLLLGEGQATTTTAATPVTQQTDSNKIGALIDLISRSMASDVGAVHFTTFLANLRARDGDFSSEDFMTAFSEEFGEDKLTALRELAGGKLGLIGFSANHSTFSSSSFSSSSISSSSSSSSFSSSHSVESGSHDGSEQRPTITKKTFKVQFKVEGHGSGATDQLQDALGELLQAAESGQLDIDYGEQQLRVAAIRLREDMEYICEAGSISRDGKCVKCPVGTFFNVILRECQPCPQGSFQPEEGQVSCLVCPANTSTKAGSAKSDADCKAQCLPGTFSKDGLEPCTTCEQGQYQDEYASLTCASCPHGTTSWRRGTWVIDECRPMCLAGQVSETGLEPCYHCPPGHFQDQEGQKECLRCPGEGSTPGRGTASMYDCEGVSSNSQAAYNTLEAVPINDCFSEPCHNQATCVSMASGYVCECAPGYSGQQCEMEVNECESEPCFNNGTCTDQLNSFNCSCPLGFSGVQCEVNINECDPDPCQNGATCIDLIDAFKCVCVSGYTGEVCDIDIDECAANPCAEGATCQDLHNDFTCVCPPGDTGRFCETHINECESSPCLHGLCLDQVNEFKCVCEPGYTGTTCEENVDECASQPCQNGATCIDGLSEFSCTCPPGYSGPYCENEMPTDFLLEFPSSGILDYASLEGFSQTLDSVSLCLWMKTDDVNNYGTPFSYATDTHDNALTLTDYSGFVVYVNGEKQVTDVRTNDGLWHLVCVTWASVDGAWAIYLDGLQKDSGTGLANGTTIEGHGMLVVGQEQDHRGGGYSPQESFVGQVTLVNVWAELLPPDQIFRTFTRCDRYIGSLVGWPDFQWGIKGQVVAQVSSFCRGCGVPRVPEDGTVNGPGTEAGNIITITCNEGFKQYRGSSERTCLVYGSWSGEEPECRRVSCGFPGHLVNGYVEGRSYSYGDTIMFTCNPGFKLIGEEQSVCQADGKWSNKIPKCDVIRCPNLSTGPHTQVTTRLADYMPTNEIRFQCEEGYQMDGPASLTCGGDGEWDGDTPQCQSSTCGELPSISNGFVEGGSLVRPGEQVVLKCEVGYKLRGEPLITCQEDFTWSRPLPRCTKPKCPKPPAVENGVVKVRASLTADGRTSQAAVYKCDRGYVLVGAKSLMCGEDEQWEGSWSLCLPPPCPAPEVPPHASLGERDVWRVGDVAEYQCEKGFKVYGNPSRACISNGVDGEWEGSVPECRVVKCPGAAKPRNGVVYVVYRPPPTSIVFPQSHTFPLLEVDSEVVVPRNKREARPLDFPSIGYEDFSDPFDSEFSQSAGPEVDYYGQSHGDYFEQSPGDGSEIFGQSSNGFDEFGQSSNGFDEFGQSSNGSEIFGQSSNGFDDFSQSSNGFDDFSQSSNGFDDFSQTSNGFDDFGQGQVVEVLEDNLYDVVVEYDCQPGHKLIGAHRRRCTETGEWDAPAPICYEDYCSTLPAVPNSHIVYTGSGINSRAEYVCNEGYTLVDGDFELLCQANKAWLGVVPSCQIVNCGQPPDVGNGTVEVTETTYGSLATYDCFFGFVLEGSAERRCSADGLWDGIHPRCVAVTCTVPPLIVNGYIAYEGNMYVNSQIEYECQECYKLNGTQYRTCTVDGTWTLEEPACNLIYCDPLPNSIPNGRVIGSDNSCGSLVEYECSAGYELRGSQKATCLDNEKWSSPTPTCERVSCGAPPPLYGGRPVGVSFLFTDKITYECDEGHVLRGGSVRVCQDNATWSGSAPRCDIVNCTTLESPANGVVTMTGRSFGSYANVLCNPGFRAVRETTFMCGATGHWDKELPQCVQIMCPPASRPPYATYNSSESHFAAFTTLHYECEEGYTASSQTTYLTCSSIGEWVGGVIECQPVSCGDPGTLPHGYINGTNFTFGNQVHFSCWDGYKLLGAPTAKCLADGSWSNYVTSCLKITCPEPDQIMFGSLVADSQDISYGTSLTYQCDAGYILQGHSNLKCGADGQWMGASPTCQPVTCPEPPEPLNSMRTGDTYEYSHNVTYTCYEGYYLVGEGTQECQADGTWSSQTPICEVITCPEIPDIPHGNWTRKSFTEFLFKTEPLTQAVVGKAAHKVKKGHGRRRELSRIQTLLPSQVEEGLIFEYGEEVEFRCDNGYSMASSGLLRCTEDGWSDSIPQCHPISCPIPINIRQGTITGDDFSFGATINYECNEGYELFGVASRTCQESKEWTDIEPYCRIIECPRPAPLVNGQMVGESVKYQSVLSYMCDPGFRLEGVHSRTCQSNGYWTDEQPMCVELFCDMPAEVPHGIRDIGSLKVGGTVRYSCVEGYRMEGAAVLNCVQERHWDTSPPRCVQIDCGPPPSGDNVVVEGNSTTYGSQVTFQCERGYHLDGPEWSTCVQSGQWTARAPLCELTLCSDPASPQHGYIVQKEETIVEEEDENEVQDEVEVFEFLPQTQKLKKSKKKGKKGKKGHKKNREVLSRVVEKIYRVDDEVTWACDEGYEARGSTKAACTESGTWSNEPVRCRRVSCSPPSYPDNAIVDVTEFLYGSTANYSCREGYAMEGTGVLRCEADGSWSSEPPTCRPVECGPPSVLPFSITHFVVAEHGVKYGYASTVSYSCVEGYELQGGEYRVCEADGTWHGDSYTCVESLCSEPPPLLNGEALIDKTVRPQRATFSCNHGYSLTGDEMVTCSLGHWLDYNTTCDPVNCFEPAVPAYGKITAKHFSLGSIANYSCMYGYMLVGNPSVECDVDATWKGDIPVCLPVDCGSLEAPTNGKLESHYTVLHSRARYSCDPGYQLFGEKVRTCTTNATWSGNDPQCFRKDCGEMKAPKYGFAMGVGTQYGDQVKFRCEEGYILHGEPHITCQASGEWSSITPTCQAVKCGPPPSPPKTASLPPALTSNRVYQDQVYYTCQDGFIMRGDLSSVCLETGQWSSVRGQCSRLSCGRPRVNTNGAVIIGRSFYYKDRVRYRCPPGTITNGSSVLTCLSDGSWSGLPDCVSNCGRRCLHGGVCLTNHVCSCPPGYVGDHCQHALCLLPCLHGGVCTGPHRCTCLPGYSGSRCQTPVCEGGCGHGSRCIGPNVCHCIDGRIAASCTDEYEYDYSYYGGYDYGLEQESTVLEGPDVEDVNYITAA
ncbi:sushi, von Willebrand factor type A, EGF and pentraxin domain-containing protein 1-like isoform X3 [Eriocheir sinensis]|uniref:sushi, von Willebrand factor type A, EGF and pentraxin domain-containing protein 1-like isoform X3 n=1 Tax=Eriocheir sinensis TaxID=95602 RepID=UPI0021C9AAB4|nr:sushi, von Willebrand factor type A, EGF and pentraxin domain-containing protein 1-like isoform X3 [Eriocheir sinensis]